MPFQNHLFQKWIDENLHLFWSHRLVMQQVYKTMMTLLWWCWWGQNSRKKITITMRGRSFSINEVISHWKLSRMQAKRYWKSGGKLFLCLRKVSSFATADRPTPSDLFERYRRAGEKDGFIWHCENCGENSMKNMSNDWYRHSTPRRLWIEFWNKLWGTTLAKTAEQ